MSIIKITKGYCLKNRVFERLNILSEQDITETKLYKTILSADERLKKLFIKLSTTIALTFADIFRFTEPAHIYEWLSIIFDRFKKEEGVDIMTIYITKLTTEFETRLQETSENIDEEIESIAFSLLGFHHADAWCKYLSYDESNIEKIAKIIKPIELFILTAITVLVSACHVVQKPFEYYVNMDFNSVILTLLREYVLIHENICKNFYSKEDQEFVSDDYSSQLLGFNLLIYNISQCEYLKQYFLPVGRRYSSKDEFIFKLRVQGSSLNKRFGKIVKVESQSEYEELKKIFEN